MDKNPRFRFKYQSTLRRLANNIQEPFRTLSLQAIDTSINWLEGKPAPRASALRSPRSLTPNLQRQLKQFLRKWHLQVLSYQVPCHNPSSKMVFIKHAAVLDQLCNHKQAITDWSSGQKAICCCKHWLKFKTAALNPSDPHWVLAGSLLHSLLPADLSVIAEGSLLNKVFPSKKRTTLSSSVVCTVGQNVMASHQCQISTFPICATKCGLNTPRMSLYYQAIDSTFQDPSIFEPVSQDPATIVTSLVDLLQQQQQHSRSYPWAVGPRRQLPAGYILAKRKKAFQSGRPIISFVDSPFRPMLNILARMIFQLIPVACPNHFASGDVYTLLEIPRSAPVDANLILINQDLAGFFTSIDQDRFIGAWFMLLDFLRPKMDVSDHEVFSIYLANPTTRVTSSRAAHSVD